MTTDNINLFEPEANSDFSISSAEERYNILMELINKGMSKDKAIFAFKGIHIPDEKHEYYLKKLEELKQQGV